MNHPFLDAVCLSCGCAAAALACLGSMRMPGALAKLHYVALASIVTPACVALAVWIEDGLGAASVKATLVAALLAAQSPLLSHVTGRALYFRRRNDRSRRARNR